MADKPTPWKAPEGAERAALQRLVELLDQRSKELIDDTPDWNGLTDRQAKTLRQAIGQYLENRLPPDIDWSVVTIVFTRRTNDPDASVDFLSASTTPWDPIEQLQEWLDDRVEYDGHHD